MPAFSLVIEYLTGYAVATDTSSREKPEWPPHPARVFMALAAAHFETDPADQAQRDALEWLATLSPPDLVVPNSAVRDVLTVYVPVNDQSDAEALLKRSRQPRSFPRVHVGDAPVRMIWRVDPAMFANNLEALEGLCRHVTRIGHSSSLVWVRLERTAGDHEPTHVYDDGGIDARFRVVSEGAVTRLEQAFNQSNIDAYASFEDKISTAKPKDRKKLKAELEQRFPQGKPTSQRPVIATHGGYRLYFPPLADAHPSAFDRHFIVLRTADDNPTPLGLESTAIAVNALRNTIMKRSLIQNPVPAWVSGHEATGQKLTSEGHMSIVPLAFVGRPWIDVERNARGHLMGLGILLPSGLSRRDASKVLAPILFDEKQNEHRRLELTLGTAGVWKIVRDSDSAPRMSLDTNTYTRPSLSWASVTPIVLDRMPKADRVKDPIGWRAEVSQIIATACTNVGLPEPVVVRVEKTPFFIGSLRAMPGQGGFPQLRKGRFQVHAQLDFDRPVAGPVVLGAGRFRGYGLMRPWQSGDEQ